MHRQIAGSLTGRVSKWLVLVVVLVITGFMGVFSAKLADVQNNEASSWLPESAESTQVLEELSESVDPNDIPTLVVYHRDGGLTEDDLAQLETDGPEIAELDGVTEQGVLTPAAAEADDGRTLAPGEWLVTKAGALRRWDGFVARGEGDHVVVAVHDTGRVDDRERVRDLGRVLQRELRRERRRQLRAEVAEREVLHRDVRDVVFLAVLVDADDVRMVQAAGGARLGQAYSDAVPYLALAAACAITLATLSRPRYAAALARE